MSVASDFWMGALEPSGSSARRIAQSFRRPSTPTQAFLSARRHASKIESSEPRRTSLAVLPFRIIRSPKSINKPSERAIHSLDSSLQRLDRVFFHLPPEIQIEIASYLDLSDIFNLRLSSRALLNFLDTNAASITRFILRKTPLADDPIYLQCLYPQPSRCITLNYMLQILRRLIIVDQIVNLVVEFIQTKIYLIRSGPRAKQFEPYRSRLRERLRKPAFMVCHYLESLLQLHLHWSKDQPGRLSTAPPRTSRSYLAALSDLVAKYPKDDVVSTLQFYKLLILDLRQSLRAPTYAGTLERTLRGWAREPAKDEDIAQILVFGGLEEVLNIITTSSYTTRVDKVMQFVEKVSNAPKRAPAECGSEASVPAKPMTSAIEEYTTPFDKTASINLDLLPPLDEILVSDFQDRIVIERLIDHERELASPFGYIQGIMADSDAAGSRLRLGSFVAG